MGNPPVKLFDKGSQSIRQLVFILTDCFHKRSHLVYERICIQ